MSKSLPTSPEPSTDLVLVNPATGTVVDPASETTDRLAQERRGVTDLKRELDHYASYLDDEIVRRLDRMGRRSAVVGGWGLETKAPTTTEYDQAALMDALLTLVATEDLLEPEVVDEVLVPVDPVPRKLNRTRLNTLLKHPDERVREALKACASEVPQRRSVTVKGPA